jgi:hypothetical protein
MTLTTRRHTDIAIDALGQITHEDLSHSLFVSLSGRVALCACADLVQVGCRVRALSQGPVVRMAVVTRVHRIAVRMAHLARRLFASMVEWKGMAEETRRTPVVRRMACGAFDAELAAMPLGLGVTLYAFARRTAEPVTGVALIAFERHVPAVEWEHRGVTESAEAIRSIVAGQAGVAHRPAVVLDIAGLPARVAFDACPLDSRRFVAV